MLLNLAGQPIRRVTQCEVTEATIQSPFDAAACCQGCLRPAGTEVEVEQKMLTESRRAVDLSPESKRRPDAWLVAE